MLAIAQTITHTGRDQLFVTKDFVENNFQRITGTEKIAKVVYGDTDSVFVEFQECSVAEAIEYGQKCADTLNAEVYACRDPMEIEYEKVYMNFLILTKKRYFGLKHEFDPTTNVSSLSPLPPGRACISGDSTTGGATTFPPTTAVPSGSPISAQSHSSGGEMKNLGLHTAVTTCLPPAFEISTASALTRSRTGRCKTVSPSRHVKKVQKITSNFLSTYQSTWKPPTDPRTTYPRHCCPHYANK